MGDPATSTATRSILLVDDDQALRGMLRRQLERAGFDVVEARDGARALERLHSREIDLVVTDLSMPNVDGHELMGRLQDTGCEVPVMVITGQGEMEDAIKALRAGAVDFLCKPFAPADFFGAIQNLFAGRRRGSGVPKAAPEQAAADDPPHAPPAAGTSSVLDALRLRLDSGQLGLPVVPSIVLEMKRIVTGSDDVVGDLVGVVEQDQELSLRIISTANSAANLGRDAARTLRDAVLRVGVQEALSVAVRSLTDRIYAGLDAPGLRQIGDAIWKRTVATATASRALARRVGGVNREEVYQLALLGEIGEPLLLRILDDVLRAQGVSPDPRNTRREVARHHCAFGAKLMERWDLGPEAIVVAERHHDAGLVRQLATRDPRLARTIFLIACGRHVALAANPKKARDAEATVGDIETCLRELGLGRDDFDQVVEELGSP